MALLDHSPAAFRSRGDASGRQPRIVQQLQMPWAAGKLSAAAAFAPARPSHRRIRSCESLYIFSRCSPYSV